MLDDTSAAEAFHHPKNITLGAGRILWAKGCTDIGGVAHAEGWVLPGGRRTLSEIEARAAALKVDSMCSGSAAMSHP